MSEEVEFRDATHPARIAERREQMGKPPLPSSMAVIPNVARSEQTLEQLEEERVWFQWKVDNVKEPGVLDWATTSLNDVNEEIARR